MAKPLDASGWVAGLDRLAGPLKESIARRMAVAGGQILRDEAQHNARVSHARSTWVYNPNGSSNSSEEAGTLADAIYLARDVSQTTATRFTYRISWNNTFAWWGRLREFGYFMRYAFYKDERGMYHTIKSRPLDKPIWIPPRPFLAPAFDSHLNAARAAMIEAGREAAVKLLAGGV